jgi:hypothetical protein
MFPLSVSGQIELAKLQPESVSALLDRVESALVEKGASTLERRGDALVVRAPFLVSQWNVLSGFDRCELSLRAGSEQVLSYDFSTRLWFTFVTVIIVAISAFSWTSSTSLSKHLFPVIAWIWILGGNYLVLRFRLRAFLKRAADRVGR